MSPSPEDKINKLLVAAWHEFIVLTPTHGDHIDEFRRGIHLCQQILMWRELQKLQPEKYPTYRE